MKILTLFRPVAVFVCLLLPLTAIAGQAYSSIYVFGDSLSDTGNFTTIFGPLPEPPYYQGRRLSNGPVAVEVLAEHLALPLNTSMHLIGFPTGNNYAVAGARAGGDTPVDLSTQQQLFFLAHGGVAPVDALYVIFFGGNDIRLARNEPDNAIANAYLDMATQAVGDLIRSLRNAGGQHFLVVNAPDIGSIPETRLIAESIGNILLMQRASLQSRYYNHRLNEQLRAIEHASDISITRFDLFNLTNLLLRLSPVLGFTNSTDGCFSPFTGIFHPDCDAGNNVDDFFFVDEIHPTARIHQYVGDALARVVSFRPEKHRKHRKYRKH